LSSSSYNILSIINSPERHIYLELTCGLLNKQSVVCITLATTICEY
jgi:hypothetical protein